ncbi:MAG: CSLREA domain-containing protein [Chloroflexi bacterium]|nr:CSLREA domain-containing protein [Chloroflexota bacterium]
MKDRRRVSPAGLLIASLLVASVVLGGVPATPAGPSPVFAAGFQVDTTDDDVDVNPGDGICKAFLGACPLRAAIMEANALPGPDVIKVPAGHYKLTRHDFSVSGDPTMGDLDILSDVAIVGAGAASTIIDADVENHIGHRVLIVGSGIQVSLNGLTVTGGKMNGFYALGGGLYNAGNLALKDVAVNNNFAIGQADLGHGPGGSAYGGGIYNAGNLTLKDVAVSDNSASGQPTWRGSAGYAYGGGIYNTGMIDLENSTIDRNRVGASPYSYHATALYNTGVVTMKNVTISDNIIGSETIYNKGPMALVNVTIAENAAPSLQNESALELHNVILTRSGGSNCSGSIYSLGNNIENGDSCGFSAPGDLSNIDPRVGPLADNGGQTQTRALLVDSPAIDRGADGACPPTDQRGVRRPFDGNYDGNNSCDVGAYEYDGPPAPTPTATPTMTPTATAAPCSPRPNVRVIVTPRGANDLAVTVTAGRGGVRTLKFTGSTNARVDIGAHVGERGAFDVDLPNAPTSLTFLVHRDSSGRAMTVPFTVVDDCGPWPTFVGLGAGG